MSKFEIGDIVWLKKNHNLTGTVADINYGLREVDVRTNWGLSLHAREDSIELIPEPDDTEKEGS